MKVQVEWQEVDVISRTPISYVTISTNGCLRLFHEDSDGKLLEIDTTPKLRQKVGRVLSSCRRRRTCKKRNPSSA